MCVCFSDADDRQTSKCFETVAFPFLQKKKEIAFIIRAFKESESTKRRESMESSSAAAAATAYNTLGVRTRAQKRRIGERDVWDLIVNNDDICFKHILPRLNRTDVKFLYGVNTETRKLIKRSSRKGDLKWTFEVKRCRRYRLWKLRGRINRCGRDYWRDETYFCWRVAQTNKLELLKWAREEKKCEWNERTINAAADQGNLEMVKYCVANECPIDRARVQCCPKRSSRGTQILTRRSQSALGFGYCLFGG